MVSLPSCPLGASVLSLRQHFSSPLCPFSLTTFPFPFCPFPSSEISLHLLSLSSPTSVLFFQESGRRAATASHLAAYGTMLPLAGSSSPSRVTSRGGRGSPHTMHTLVQGALPDGGFMRMIAVQTSYHVVAGSPIIPIFSPLFSCHQEKSHWEWAEAADFYILLYAWVKVPRVGWEPTDDIQIVCTGESHTCGSESHRRHTTGGFLASVHHCSPSLALSGSVQVGV